VKHDIPSTIGLLLLSAAGLGCSDAQKVANAYEKVCKADCECPGTGWTHVKNCKTACEGYAKMIEAQLEESEDEPCAELDDLLDALTDCTKNSCESLDACVDMQYDALFECWSPYDYYYTNIGEETAAEIEATLDALSRPISRPLLRAALYSAAARDQAEAAEED
jgi:hypothetical protein